MKTESMLSAGIDIGTTTTHLVISRIGIGVTEGFGTVPSVHITSKKVLIPMFLVSKKHWLFILKIFIPPH